MSPRMKVAPQRWRCRGRSWTCCCYACSAAIVAEAGEIAAVDETRSVISLSLDAEEKLPTPRLSRLLLRFGALAVADVVSQTQFLKLFCRCELHVAEVQS
jgi:hypothetical protein